MQSVQHAYDSQLLPGIADAVPITAPANYVKMHFTEHLNKMYTRMPISSAPTTPKSTHGLQFLLGYGGRPIAVKGQGKQPQQHQVHGPVHSNS
eukprot:5156007-Karenia_brevis.AAC.1